MDAFTIELTHMEQFCLASKVRLIAWRTIFNYHDAHLKLSLSVKPKDIPCKKP
jgi:hypothetical protein